MAAIYILQDLGLQFFLGFIDDEGISLNILRCQSLYHHWDIAFSTAKISGD